MLLILLLIVAVLLLGGGSYGRWGGRPAYAGYGTPGLSLGAFLLIVVVILALTGNL